jgi:cytochrome c biogenesis protein CcdA
VFFLCASLLCAAGTPALVFSPAVWKFGMIRQGAKLESAVTAANHESRTVTVTFVPTCTCLGVTPAAQRIPAGGEGVFVLSYDSSDDTGNTTRGYIVRSDLPGAKPQYFLLRGTVRAEHGVPPDQSGASPTRDGAPGRDGKPVVLFYYYTPGCRSCEEFLSTEVPRLEKKLGIKIEVQRRDVLDSALYGELAAFAESRGQSLRAIPALRSGDTLLQGDPEIRQKLEGILDAAPSAPAAAQSSSSAASVTDRLAILPVIAAGLIDGINPCAFTTLIFLLASLALAGRGRREVLLIGALFSLAVFLTYFAIGMGFLAALRAASVVSLVSVILRWALVIVLLTFAGLSVYDYTLIRKGRPTEILLQLPSVLKKRIHASIRTRVRTMTLAGSSLVLGFLVSVFEFACTGQVYLPLLGYLVRVRRQPDAVGLLVLYNFCFIAPLLVVFGASYLGASSGRITAVFQAHMGKVKLGLAVVFAGLAVFTLVG